MNTFLYISYLFTYKLIVNGFMLSISIGWPYFLGLMGSLILIAWYSNGRFTALETSMDWVKEILKDLKTGADNASNPAFGAHSPVNLNPTGEAWIVESGLKEYIDSHKDELLKQCEDKRNTNPYEVQKHIFKLFDEMQFDTALDDKLKKFAFQKGTTMSVLRRVGGIYLRNVCLDNFGMAKEDIDKHDPAAVAKN
jgi:hypothetical protein